MKKIHKSNIVLILSFVFLLFTSAFTLNTDAEEILIEEELITCKTCAFDSSGPSGCMDAQFCGLTVCGGACNQQGGTLCGECAREFQ